MPGFHPKRKTITPAEIPEGLTPINFNYMTIQSHESEEPVFVMSFEQLIFLLDQITDSLHEEEQSAMYHLTQIKHILRKYLRDGH
jgi:hypothetical protein